MAVNTWGFGPARLVPSKKEEVVVFLSDFHVPHHDMDAVASAVRMVKAIKPDRVVLNGDIGDFHGLSRFNTSGERLDALQEEINEANDIRLAIRKAAPNAVIDECEGNHDNRIISYVRQNARALASLEALEPRKLFRYDDLGINWHPGSGFRLRKDFIVRHGTIVRGEAGASAKAEFMQFGVSGLSGHTHRLATYRKAGYTTRSWTEGGCLCRTDPDYVKSGVPNWTVGCTVGEFSRVSFVIHEVPFIDGGLRLGLKSY